MQTLFEVASHIAQEIERTRQHLTNLEQALDGLKPLVTVDAATTTMTYAISPQPQAVEDLSVVNAEETAKKMTKPKLTSKTPTEKTKAVVSEPVTAKAVKTKAVKTKAVEASAAVPEPVVEQVKLPSTGAELWLKCIGRKKVTVAQIADEALKKLKLDDSARDVIATRAKAWTYAAAKKGALVEAGMRDGSKLYQLAPAKDEGAAQTTEAVARVEAAEVAKIVEVSDAA